MYVCVYVCMCVCAPMDKQVEGLHGVVCGGGQEGSGHRVATGQAVSGIRDLTCARAVAGCLREDCRNHQLLFTWVDEWVINRRCRCMWVDETRQGKTVSELEVVVEFASSSSEGKGAASKIWDGIGAC